MERRTVLLGGAASMAAGVVPLHGFASQSLPLEAEVVQRVKALTGGKAGTLNLLMPQGAEGNVEPIVKRFAEQTGIRINITVSNVDDINTDLLLDAYGQTGQFDVALPATFAVRDLIAAQAILPISGYAERHEPAGFRERILFDVGDAFDGETYGFQTDGDAYTMFYHKGLLEDPDEQARYADQFGTALNLPQTWAELDRQMAYFHRPDQGLCGGLLFRTPGYLVWEWWVRFHAKGIWPMSEDMQPQIASDAGVCALEDMIRATEFLCPEVSELGLFDNWERYSRGDVYCNIGWGGTQKYLNGPRSKMRGNMVYGPTPGGMVDDKLLITPYFNWGWSYVVSNNSRRPELSYLFALFASSPNMSTLAVRQQDGYFDPFRPEHYDDAGIKAAYSPEFLKVHRHSLENAIPDLYLQNQGEYFRTLGTWLNRALNKEVSPQEALMRAAARWRLTTAASDQAKQQKRWMELRGKYPANVRERLKDIG